MINIFDNLSAVLCQNIFVFFFSEDDSMGDDAGVKMPMGVLSSSGNSSEVGQTVSEILF
jgi:hypothetical protein